METKLIISDSEHDSNMFYATGSLVPDDFIYLEKNGKKMIFIDDLELDRVKKEAQVDQVISYSHYASGIDRDTFGGILLKVLKENEIDKVSVPGNFKMKYASILLSNKIGIEVVEPFNKGRMIKSEKEIKKISDVQRSNEDAFNKAIAIIKKSKIRTDRKLDFEGKVLTSEFIREILQIEFAKKDCFCDYRIIVSCGEMAADPHEAGTGPLLANETIIIDIVPKSRVSRYYSDMTRTIVRGRASEKVKKIYQTVLAGQKLAISKIRAGVKGKDIHKLVQDYFTGHGYRSGEKDGKVYGFIHGTGHGVGLDIHESPNLNCTDETMLKSGNIVTVEPGLYYPGIGGVRLEDIAAVTRGGCENLTKFPKVLEI